MPEITYPMAGQSVLRAAFSARNQCGQVVSPEGMNDSIGSKQTAPYSDSPTQDLISSLHSAASIISPNFEHASVVRRLVQLMAAPITTGGFVSTL